MVRLEELGKLKKKFVTSWGLEPETVHVHKDNAPSLHYQSSDLLHIYTLCVQNDTRIRTATLERVWLTRSFTQNQRSKYRWISLLSVATQHRTDVLDISESPYCQLLLNTEPTFWTSLNLVTISCYSTQNRRSGYIWISLLSVATQHR
jgi:hypothetical protein